MTSKAEIGIIGGSGVYQLDGAEVIETIKPNTPFGYPSDEITIAKIEGKNVAFLPRHGKGHIYLPTEVPSKANIYALKLLGVQKIISISAVGSLKSEIHPLHFVIPSQIIDRTKSRDNSFFGNGIVGHVAFANPFCQNLQNIFYKCLSKNNITVHINETLVCMEGPLFSTKAESNLYKSWGCGIVGMTALPEAKLAREAEICYAIIAMATDYDCWHEEEESVSVDMVVNNMKINTLNIKKVLPDIIKNISLSECECNSAAQFAVMTDKKYFPEKTKDNLNLFYGKYWNK